MNFNVCFIVGTRESLIRDDQPNKFEHEKAHSIKKWTSLATMDGTKSQLNYAAPNHASSFNNLNKHNIKSANKQFNWLKFRNQRIIIFDTLS